MSSALLALFGLAAACAAASKEAGALRWRYQYTASASTSIAGAPTDEGASFSASAEVSILVLHRPTGSSNVLCELRVVDSIEVKGADNAVHSIGEGARHPLYFEWSETGAIIRIAHARDEDPQITNMKRGLLSALHHTNAPPGPRAGAVDSATARWEMDEEDVFGAVRPTYELEVMADHVLVKKRADDAAFVSHFRDSHPQAPELHHRSHPRAAAFGGPAGGGA